jgi:hypothetical protein
MDPKTHRRYLDYRERYEYFVRGEPKPAMLAQAEFVALEVELRALEAKGEAGRDDEDEARLLEVVAILLRD